jgi:hypothetical protein
MIGSLAWLVLILGFAGTARQWLRNRGRGLQGAIDSMMPLSAAAALLTITSVVVFFASTEWAEAKLAPVVGMMRGYPLYQDPSSGVMTGWIYGPVVAIVLLPVSVAHHPTTVGLLGGLITALCYFVPAWWLLRQAGRGSLGSVGMAALALFAWMTITQEALTRCATLPGADAAALGLGALACAAVYTRRTGRNMILSALAAVLCVWTKQSFIPLLFALALFVGIVDGAKKALVYAVTLVAIGVPVSLGFLLWFGSSRMYFHMVALPASHPIGAAGLSKTQIWWGGVRDLLTAFAFALALLLAAVLLDSRILPKIPGIRRRMSSRPWIILILASVALVPSALLGYLKIGGNVNNLGAPIYFVCLGALAAIVRACVTAPAPLAAPVRSFTTTGLILVGVAVGTVRVFSPPGDLIERWSLLRRPYENKQEMAFEYVRAHPREVYLPWNPLITLLADNSLYHFEWGVLDRFYAKRPPSENQFREHIPSRMRDIVYLRRPQSTAAQLAFTDFRTLVEVPELKDCIVYQQHAALGR